MVMNKLQTFSCEAFLDVSGVMRRAHIRREADNWVEFLVEDFASTRLDNGYVIPLLPVEFHCHGIGESDFSDLESIDLEKVNEHAKQEGILCILCIFLPHQKLEAFTSFMQKFAADRKNGKFTHIPGISLEGPLLASFGGTPEKGMWAPTKVEWRKLAECGKLGLQYIVLSPDAMLDSSPIAGQMISNHSSIEWIVSILLESGIRVALGHFQKGEPAESAKCIQSILRVAEDYGNRPLSGMIITDHLFNDMPLNFRHAWRTKKDRTHREDEIKLLHLDRWSIDNLAEMLGEVPATLVRAAHEGLLTLCLNFDNEHVDLEICRRIVELIGTKSLIAMTDRTDVNELGGQKLEQKEGANLWYQERGVVAAGSTSIDHQMNNLRSIGLSEEEIWDVVSFVPSRILGISPNYGQNGMPMRWCYVSEKGKRYCVDDD